MATGKDLTKEEFIQKFKFEYALAVKDPLAMESYEKFCSVIAKLRRASVQYLRSIGVSGDVRCEYNNAVQRLAETSHRKYLFYKDPTCKICGYLIEKLQDATIDHIIPTSKGGPNTLKNKQIAHGHCNVKKSNKIGFTMIKKHGVKTL